MEENNYVKRLINSVGPSNFVKYFHQFKCMYHQGSNVILTEVFKNEEWKESSRNNIASMGKRIFREGLERNALQIIAESKHESISKQAIELLETLGKNRSAETVISAQILAKISEANFSILKDIKSNTQTEQKQIIKQLQNNLADCLNTLENSKVSTEVKISEEVKDSVDIYGKIGEYPVIVELDTLRADQISKKFVSRIALENIEPLIYIAICYPGTDSMPKPEGSKYFNYCRSILKRINSESIYLGIMVDEKGIIKI